MFYTGWIYCKETEREQQILCLEWSTETSNHFGYFVLVFHQSRVTLRGIPSVSLVFEHTDVI